MEVVDDSGNTGGYVIFTYANDERSPEVSDDRVETFEDVRAYFGASDWRVDWGRRRKGASALG